MSRVGQSTGHLALVVFLTFNFVIIYYEIYFGDIFTLRIVLYWNRVFNLIVPNQNLVQPKKKKYV